MEVELLARIPDSERLIAAATRGTRRSEGAAEILEEIDDQQVRKAIVNAVERGHESVIEFAVYVFSITGVSRVLTHQLVRHRIASYLQLSSRDTDLGPMGYVTPQSIENKSGMLRIYDDSLKQSFEAYRKLLDGGIPHEDARYLVPDGTCTNIVMCMNARSLNNFFRLRLCFRAQDEIRELAERLRDLVRHEDPLLFLNAERPCIVTSECKEGADTCPRKYFKSPDYEDDLKRHKEMKKDVTSR